jgi:DNA-3-methyladenine glycosylase I
MGKARCAWAGEEKIYQDYHDREWGRPVRDGRLLFEFLSLECLQAGLSWLTILKKRDSLRRAYSGF